MDLQLLPIDRRWISQELAPYLRCSFSHAIPFEADIWPQIQSALQFCMHKPVGRQDTYLKLLQLSNMLLELPDRWR